MSDQTSYPPFDHEDLIVEPTRVQWIIKHYLKRLRAPVRAVDKKFSWIMCDPHGFVWGVLVPECTLENFQHPSVHRYIGVLLGEDNLEVCQPLPFDVS